MKIIRKNNTTGTLLSAVPIGSCFLDFEGQVCMKIDDPFGDDEEHLNVVFLATGLLAGFDPSLYVNVVDAELIVEG
jgi:hypothetical protein